MFAIPQPGRLVIHSFPHTCITRTNPARVCPLGNIFTVRYKHSISFLTTNDKFELVNVNGISATSVFISVCLVSVVIEKEIRSERCANI